MWKLSDGVFVDDEERSQSLLDEDSEDLCSLTPVQRLYAFGGCLTGGVVCMILLEGITFGPGQQIRMMFDSVRIFATAIYLGCVVLALICALWIHNKILTVFAMISEICALIWYSLSYIPFARRMVSQLMVRFCDTEL